ncbi:hypothetical protein JCM1840_005307 [Sporobolomyces johnsonii]
MSTDSYSHIYPSPDPDRPSSLPSTDSPSSWDFGVPATSTFVPGRLSPWAPAAQTMDSFDAYDFTGASLGGSGRDGRVGMSSSRASDVVETPDQWGLLLSFDDVAVPPLPAPASLSTSQQNFQRREPSASPLSWSFAPSPLSGASASSLSPPFSTSSMTPPTPFYASSDHSPPAFVHTFRLPSPATTSCPLNRSSTVSPILPSTSTSLDAAVSILNSPSTSTRGSGSPAPTPDDAPNLYVSLESAAARLKLPPSLIRNNSDTARQRSASTVDSDLGPSRPKRSKSFKAETSHLSSSTTSEAGEVEPEPKAAALKRKKRGEGHIPRAPNAWICYRSACLKELVERGHAPTRQSDVSKLIATMWRQETPEVRAQYAQRATIEAEAHAEKYPGYCYKPKRRSTGAEGDSPRRKVTKARTTEGRKRAQTASAVDSAVSDWAFTSPVPNDPRRADPSSTLLPSPSISETPTIASYDFDVGAFFASLDGCPVTPSTCSSSRFDSVTSTLPSSPASDVSDAWAVFQSASTATFDSFLAESSSSPAYDTFPIPPYSAPASLASSGFNFDFPPPLFDPEPPAVSMPLAPSSLSSHQSCAPSLESYTFPPAPVRTTPLSTPPLP